MKRHFFFGFLLLLFFTECKKAIQDTSSVEEKTGMYIPIKRRGIDQLSNLSKQNINKWKAYENLHSFLQQLNNTSANDAINMAVELNSYVKTLRDSTSIEPLKTNSLEARFNVLENEVLRLKDMTLIPAIKPDEINNQVDKILLVFNSYTQKINTIYSKKKFDEEIDLELLFEKEK